MYSEKRNRKEEILQAASEFFAQSGFRGATLSAIAEEVGLTVPGLLHYFPSKTALLQSVLEFRDQSDKKKYEVIDTDEKGSMFAALQDLVETNQNRRGLVQLFTVMVAESINPEHPSHEYFLLRYRKLKQTVVEYLKKTIHFGKMDGQINLENLATLVFAVMDGLQIQWLLDPQLVDMSQAFKLFTSALEAYIGAENQDQVDLITPNGEGK